MKDFGVSFGVIVLNGEPFTRYCLRALYPMAHQILVVEGAAPGAKQIATSDGHSQDGTLEVLRRFKAEEDPNDTLTIVTAEDEGHPDGFWPGEKDEMSRSYAKRATGQYLWQVDVDEFYKPEDMRAVIEWMEREPELHAASFKQIQFWGGFDAYADSWYLRRGGEVFHRLFRWGEGCEYVTHRPPTVTDDAGRDLRRMGHLDAETLAERGIFLYHYSLVFPKQVREKCRYYGSADWAKRDRAEQWAERVFMRLECPYRAHNVYDYPGWLEPFAGAHPPMIERMRADLACGALAEPQRHHEDIDRLLASRRYRWGVRALKALDYADRLYCFARRFVRQGMRAVQDPRRALRMLRWRWRRAHPDRIAS